MRFKTALGLAVIGLVAGTLPVWSHHAHGNYAPDPIDMEGVITELHRINPHPWIYIEVTDPDSQKQVWALEGGAQRDQDIKTGDTIKVRCFPLRDGNRACQLGFLKAPDGTVVDWDEDRPVPQDF